jgi:hypothetical protein
MVRLLASALVLGSILRGSVAVADNAADHRAKILGRLKELENISVRYRRGDRFYPRPDSLKVRELPGGGKIVPKTDPDDWVCEFQHFRGRAMYERQQLVAVRAGEEKQVIWAVSDDRRESLVETDHISGVVQRERQLPPLEYIDIALGLRAFGSDTWLTEERLKSAEIEVHDGLVSLSWLDGVRFSHVYDFDPKQGYALVGYTRSGRGHMLSRIENSDFRRVDGVFLPFNSHYTEYRSEGGQPTPSREVIMDMQDYSVGDERNTKDDFRIEWPLKSNVTHHELKVSVQVMSRPQKLDEAIFQKAAGGD